MPERTVRELGDEHRARFQEFVDYAFDAVRGPTSYDSPEETPRMLGRKFGVFEAGELRSVCIHHDFSARVREDWLPMTGLAAVATPPEHRREGLGRTLVEDALQRWRGEYPLAALWPFEHAYYRQFGWALSNTSVRYACPPAALAPARGADGTARRVGPEEWGQLQGVHEAHGADRNLTLRRDGEWWRRRVFRSLGGGKRYVYAVEREGRVDGYVAYTVENGGTQLRVSDLAFRDHGAYRRILGLLADHDSQVEEVVLYREDERSLFSLVDDPEAVDCTVSPGPQVRVVDVEHALEALSYPEDVAATLRLAVTDRHAPWNDGLLELRVDGGTGECRWLDDGGASADVSLGIGALSQLYVGFRSAAELDRTDSLGADGGTAGTLGALFPPETVYLREYF
ncbi:GNAT family N-acetyltransferase [Salinirussus salinus]|uniref:GNAT family N-acetyltransferase n=1 Tax=Salinirussus salinus TaxID=1198300 RepID=UPI00135927C3|nr:GNAT family N-acetyltransferase [Salinirussus salinus]